MLEVAEGVMYLHSEGIVHGDLHGVSSQYCISQISLSHYLLAQCPPRF
jgi:hypothetical protein